MKTTVFLGWDPRETEAYEVARNSILRHTRPEQVEVIPLKLGRLHQFTRPIERRGNQLWCPISNAPMATEFAISRFCVPLIHKEGWALFADCDIVCTADIEELFALADDRYAVMVVKHKQEAGPDTKMDGQLQTFYAPEELEQRLSFQLRARGQQQSHLGESKHTAWADPSRL